MGFKDLNAYYKFANSVKNNRAPMEEEAKEFLSHVRETVTDRDVHLEKGRHLFRGQLGCAYRENEYQVDVPWGFDEDRMLPKLEHITPGRCNQANQVVLYLASSVDTAISELRPWLAQEISVAQFEVISDLKILNLVKGNKKDNFLIKQFCAEMRGDSDKIEAPDQDTINEYVWYDIDKAFSRPVTKDDSNTEYAPTQILSELFRSMGYDGVIYKSAFGDDMGYNIALFELKNVKLKNSTPYEVKKIKLDFDMIGDTWFRK